MTPEKSNIPEYPFLPVTADEMQARGWDQADIILVTGDAYIDHPSFGTAILARIAERLGLRVAVLPQPNWRDDLRDFKKLGVPRLFFGVSAGAMDSMVNHYTALRRRRSDDAYTPGGRAGYRPDYASVVYTGILKKIFPEIPVVLGGVEASMRRFTHYDYWQDKVKPSILVESGADLLLYGMAEQAWRILLDLVMKGVPLQSIRNLPQSAYMLDMNDPLPPLKNSYDIHLPSYKESLEQKNVFADAFRIIEEASNSLIESRLMQDHGSMRVVVNPPLPVVDEKTFDQIWELPYTRSPHPKYNKKPPIPAWEMIKFSVNIHRGCFGGCSFCAINMHQGKFVQSRSQQSILTELEQIASMPYFKGHISDLGGPSANMYKMSGIDTDKCRRCKRPSCIFPAMCNNLNIDHHPLLDLYEKAERIPGIEKVTIGSGVRYDMLMGKTREQNKKFGLQPYIQKLLKNHVSGRLKVAPEHTSSEVLNLMRKPSFNQYEEFQRVFQEICNKESLPWQLVPYFISGHPGTVEQDMKDLNIKLKKLNCRPEQVQQFTPTPMTLATTIYYTGINPYTGRKIFVARDDKQKRRQKDFFFKKML
jgi:uncharacterized radical SAM protein YgiQ